MLMEQARIDIVKFGKQMSADALSRGTSGNLSVFDPETGYMAISPSGIGYFETNPEDVAVVTLDGKIVDGTAKPSTELDLHAYFYKKKPHARGVVHTHSVFCSTFACLGEPLRATHYLVGLCGATKVPCAPFGTPGSVELARNAADTAGESNAVLLANHGLITCGNSLAKAYMIARNMEFAAEMQWRAMAVGKPVILSDEDMAGVMQGFKNYGQPAKEEKKDAKGY